MATVRLRRLARDLRRYREAAGLTSNAVADRLGWDRTKISRLETAKVVRPRQAEIAELLDLYGVASPERDSLLQLTLDARRRGWWAAYGDVFDGTFPGLEDEAATIRSWDTQFVPGLLQTDAYAWAVLSAADQSGDTEQVHKRVQGRMARRPLLNRPGGSPQFHAVLDESVLRRQVGAPGVMEAQLTDLWAACHRPNVTLQVLPFEAGAHAGVDAPFVILGFPDGADPDVVFVDGLAGAMYPESEQAIRRFNLAFERLTEAALPPEESAYFLADLTRRTGVIS